MIKRNNQVKLIFYVICMFLHILCSVKISNDVLGGRFCSLSYDDRGTFVLGEVVREEGLVLEVR